MCGQEWEGPHVTAYAHVFMHSVLLLVSQCLSVWGFIQGRSAASVSTAGMWLIPQLWLPGVGQGEFSLPSPSSAPTLLGHCQAAPVAALAGRKAFGDVG